ncbi:MAG: Rne/Rng family ribonuclease [Candidatus Kapabacteria bacterium]|nr:Rne/Rng family ribonuclease [Ignavibacteriota bacterium]MCW5885731.1 Rne/Rng family ribonuclease [Candidatus Kapabacteria bacterium]
MKKEIIINSAINEVRVAITEDGELAEYFIELPNKERYIGSIYYGKVSKILQGINAAFIDIGLNQDAFLHFSDVDENLELNVITEEDDDESLDSEIISETNETNEDNEPEPSEKKPAKKNYKNQKNNRLAKFKTKRSGEVTINLKEGQWVLVQIVREAYANKGVKVTSKIAIPGRYVVFLPKDELVGVSRKISSYQERRRLRSTAKKFLPKGAGCIIRTASRGKNEEELKRDWIELLDIWSEIEKKMSGLTKPGNVYMDMQLANSIVRDLFTPNVQRVNVDSKKLYKDLNNYIKRVSPHLENRVELYTGKNGIFEDFGIDKELAKTYKRRVNLTSGGDVMIEHTEAMTVIDVNSGKGSDRDQERNAFKTNMEAMKEVAKQIRLRDLGGMIIIDFIDMTDDNNRKKLYNEMKKEMARDRAKTVIYPLSQLGLMQITRQRINQNIVEKLTESCPMCKGSGRITSKAVLINEIDRWLKNFRRSSSEFRLILSLHPNVADFITKDTWSVISKLMIKYFARIKVQQSDSVGIDQFKFFSVRQQKDITGEYL